MLQIIVFFIVCALVQLCKHLSTGILSLFHLNYEKS